jgi:pimeloyl-[acyl-carrier protein] methyl ester esterase
MSCRFPKLILLPGMDGTGMLFREFSAAFPDAFESEFVRYPSDRCLSYAQLAPFVDSAIPISESFVIVAESFSTPLAIQCAATNPPNLKGLVICAGFATSPAPGWRSFIYSLLVTPLFSVALPEFAARRWLVGSNASSSLVASVRTAVSSVNAEVLSCRLRAILACDVRAELSQVAVPILYIQAEQDRLVDASCLEEIRRIKPQTTVATIAGPHLLLQREPQRTAAVVTEFIRQACD